MPELRPFPREPNAAARASRSRLDAILHTADLSFREFVALNLLAPNGSSEAAEMRRELAEAFRTDQGVELNEEEADAPFRRLGTAALVQEGRAGGADGPITVGLTAAGESLHRTILDAVAQSSAEFLRGIAPRDLETTHRVLHELGLRAAR